MKMRRYSGTEDEIIKACINKMMVATEIAEALTQAGYTRDYGSVYMHCRDALKIKIPNRRAVPKSPPKTRARYEIGKSKQLGVHVPGWHLAEWQSWLDTISDVMRDAKGHPTLTKVIAYCLKAGAEKAEREAAE